MNFRRLPTKNSNKKNVPFLSDYYGNKQCLSKTGMSTFQQTIKEFYRLLLTLPLQTLHNALTPDLLLGRSLRFRSVWRTLKSNNSQWLWERNSGPFDSWQNSSFSLAVSESGDACTLAFAEHCLIGNKQSDSADALNVPNSLQSFLSFKKSLFFFKQSG